ncbi:MAG: SIMPL domain-containing protein [Spirochaetales bacterium]|nr:SIMPL domain-containing protein [Spirochaetales bacterium]
MKKRIMQTNKKNHSTSRISSFVYILLSVSAVIILLSLAGCASLSGKPGMVTLEGTGTVTAVPDTVSLTLSISEIGATTREAQTLVNEKVAKILTILKTAKVKERNIRTAAINFTPEYSWNEGIQTLQGQRANQTIVFLIEDMAGQPEQVSLLLDDLTSVDGIRIQNMHFDIKDKTKLYSDSRALAFMKAHSKASEYAALSGLELGRVLSISEITQPSYGAPTNNRMLLEAAGAGDGTPTSLPTGEIEVTSRITVIFQLK